MKLIFGLLIISFTSLAQNIDTVRINLANTSQVIFTIKDRNDLPTLRNYNFQALFADILNRIEASDSTRKVVQPDSSGVVTNREVYWGDEHETDHNFDENESSNYTYVYSNRSGKRTWQSFNFDFGTNNFLQDGKFPDENNEDYAVRPWGSWYIGLNSIQRTRVAKKFYIEWGLGVSWYNFKFENDNVRLIKTDSILGFEINDPSVTDITSRKSKLTAFYVNASLIPVLDFGDNKYKVRFWDGDKRFRIGLGPYVGYRIDSYTKVVYKKDGDKEKDRSHSNYYLNNLRYGMRLQLGLRGTDLFFNYDLNELFAANKGPKLNAFSFGIIF